MVASRAFWAMYCAGVQDKLDHFKFEEPPKSGAVCIDLIAAHTMMYVRTESSVCLMM